MTMYNISDAGWEAIKGGEKPFDEWTKDEITAAIMEVRKAEKCPFISYRKFGLISESVLKEYMLQRKSWHHVNRKCAWFYVLYCDDIINLTESGLNKMVAMTKEEKKGFNQKRPVTCETYQWRVSPSGKQYMSTHYARGIAYQGNVYFEFYEPRQIHPDTCSIKSSLSAKYLKTHKNISKLYERIASKMTKNIEPYAYI